LAAKKLAEVHAKRIHAVKCHRRHARYGMPTMSTALRAAAALLALLLAAASTCTAQQQGGNRRDDGCARVLESDAYSLFYTAGDFSGFQAFQAVACARDWQDLREQLGSTGCGLACTAGGGGGGGGRSTNKRGWPRTTTRP
jgi:hypothetical protein